MQQFTEFMELFLSIWELIKTLNLYFVCVFEHQFESGWLVGTWAVWPLPAVCPPGLLALPRPQPAACSALQPTPAHRRGPCSPGSPRSCSAVLSVGALVPKCSEVEVSTAGFVCGMPCWVSTFLSLLTSSNSDLCALLQSSRFSNTRPAVPASCCADSLSSELFR